MNDWLNSDGGSVVCGGDVQSRHLKMGHSKGMVGSDNRIHARHDGGDNRRDDDDDDVEQWLRRRAQLALGRS